MDKVEIYSDGCCKGNPGKGGYGTIIRFTAADGKVYKKEYQGGFLSTTNNRMELLGAIIGLEALTRPCEVDLYSDSSYLINAFNKGWVSDWIKNSWKTSSKKPVKNQELWKRLMDAAEPHQITWHWVKGHAGNPLNERCDQLANLAAADSDNLK